MQAHHEGTPEDVEFPIGLLRQTVAVGCSWCEKPFCEEDVHGENGAAILVDRWPWRYYCSGDCIIRAAGEK